MLEIQGRKPLKGARDRELVDHYKWKVGWLRMDGMHAVRVFKAVIRIQKVLRGHFARQRMNKSKEDGIGAIELAVKNAVTVGIRDLEDKLAIGPPATAAPSGGSDSQLLQQISQQ